MKLRVQRVASVASWDRPRFWLPRRIGAYTPVAVVLLAGWSYELWVLRNVEPD